METIGERIKYLRKGKNLTQTELAKRIGVAFSVISNWENNTNFPRGDYVALLAKEFQVTTDYLLGSETEYGEKEQSERPQYHIDEQILLQAYRSMSPGKKQALFQMLDLDENAIKHIKKTS